MIFLQTKSWMEFQRSVERKTFEYDKNGIKAYVIKHDTKFNRNFLYIPYGPDMDFNKMQSGIGQNVDQFVSWLHNIARNNNSMFIKVEPMTNSIAEVLVDKGFTKSSIDIQPHKTVKLDITQAQDELLVSMHHKTRYNIKIAKKNEVKVREVETTDNFWNLLQKTSTRDKFGTYKKEYYDKLYNFFQSDNNIKVRIFEVVYQDRPVASAMVLIYEDTGYYLHGASDYEYRSVMAPYALHWEIILQLKVHGLQIYDMWGIDSKKYPGVTRFKLGWGCRIVEYPGAFDLPISKFWTWVYNITKRVHN